MSCKTKAKAVLKECDGYTDVIDRFEIVMTPSDYLIIIRALDTCNLRNDADVCKASLMMALSYIDTTLTIDAMPVVRCKECKHRAEWNGAYGCGLDGCFGDRYTDGFCDRAERREE